MPAVLLHRLQAQAHVRENPLPQEQLEHGAEAEGGGEKGEQAGG